MKRLQGFFIYLKYGDGMSIEAFRELREDESYFSFPSQDYEHHGQKETQYLPSGYEHVSEVSGFVEGFLDLP